MMRTLRRLTLALTAVSLVPAAAVFAAGGGADSLASTDSPGAPEPSAVSWRSGYGQAWREAEKSGKMLFIWFRGDGEKNRKQRSQLERRLNEDQDLARKLQRYVPVRLSEGTEILSGGKPVRLLEHDAFREMHGGEGIAVVDLADKDSETFGHVVSAFPLRRGKYYTFQTRYLPAILDLPRGTITQRTMIWAVRVHPEQPASTRGQSSPTLLKAACDHSRYQAKITLQGHQHWEGRFHRLRNLLGGRYAPVEVVAESWPNETMLDSCIDCVDSWRHSSGHWHAVSSRHALYGYDIHRGANGIWYGTGIFAGED